ncbi:MAG: formylglycine-generating enzyme family protein [Planctomycetes bacterium]|nr:formylglycine-generating enzyme family protein [Planctomycetota bacterium]
MRLRTWTKLFLVLLPLTALVVGALHEPTRQAARDFLSRFGKSHWSASLAPQIAELRAAIPGMEDPRLGRKRHDEIVARLLHAEKDGVLPQRVLADLRKEAAECGRELKEREIEVTLLPLEKRVKDALAGGDAGSLARVGRVLRSLLPTVRDSLGPDHARVASLEDWIRQTSARIAGGPPPPTVATSSPEPKPISSVRPTPLASRPDPPPPAPLRFEALSDEISALIAQRDYQNASELIEDWKRKVPSGKRVPEELQREEARLPQHFSVPNVWFFYVPKGQYRVGTPKGEVGRVDRDELEPFDKDIEGFWVSETEVTQAAFSKVIPAHIFPKEVSGGEFPACAVDYTEAINYCTTLSGQDQDFDYCLPTELEWEVACRAMQSPELCPVAVGPSDAPKFQKKLVDELAQCLQPFSWFQANSNSAYPFMVAQKRPNPMGLRDMMGNVSEWCRFDDAVTYDESIKFGKRPQRGGSVQSPYLLCRAGARKLGKRTEKSMNVGFRLIARPKPLSICKCD